MELLNTNTWNTEVPVWNENCKQAETKKIGTLLYPCFPDKAFKGKQSYYNLINLEEQVKLI